MRGGEGTCYSGELLTTSTAAARHVERYAPGSGRAVVEKSAVGLWQVVDKGASPLIRATEISRSRCDAPISSPSTPLPCCSDVVPIPLLFLQAAPPEGAPTST